MLRSLVSVYLGVFSVLYGAATLVMLYGGVDPGTYSMNANIFFAAWAVHVGR
jgi:hypothetical protein